MTWGGLNNALTSWRNGLMRRFPNKDTRTDGARADAAHGSNSEHQADTDGTVDAYDCDINWFRSSDPDGNTVEDRISEAVKADFMADPRSRLWIHNRQIANKNVQDGRVRSYGGASPHTEHIHFEAIQRLEDDGRPWAMPRTDALLRELEEDDMALSDADKTWLSNEIEKRVGDVVVRWTPAGDRVPDDDPNPRMTAASALFYLGITVARIETKLNGLIESLKSR